MFTASIIRVTQRILRKSHITFLYSLMIDLQISDITRTACRIFINSQRLILFLLLSQFFFLAQDNVSVTVRVVGIRTRVKNWRQANVIESIAQITLLVNRRVTNKNRFTTGERPETFEQPDDFKTKDECDARWSRFLVISVRNLEISSSVFTVSGVLIWGIVYGIWRSSAHIWSTAIFTWIQHFV